MNMQFFLEKKQSRLRKFALCTRKYIKHDKNNVYVFSYHYCIDLSPNIRDLQESELSLHCLVRPHENLTECKNVSFSPLGSYLSV